jgi:hypothetical protein
MGVIADALRANLRELAQADARMLREIGQHLGEVNRVAQEMNPVVSMKDCGSLVKGKPVFPPAPTVDEEIAAAIALLRANGYTVTR